MADNAELDPKDPFFYYADEPGPGEGHWFLVRGVTKAGGLTYDAPGNSQVASRDVAINDSVFSCP